MVREKHSKLEISGLRLKPEERTCPTVVKQVKEVLVVPPLKEEDELREHIDYSREL